MATKGKEGFCSSLFFTANLIYLVILVLPWVGAGGWRRCSQTQQAAAMPKSCCSSGHSLTLQETSLVLVCFPAMKAKLKQAEFRKAFKRVTGERDGKCFNWLLKLPLNCHRAIFSKTSFPLAKFIRKLTSAPLLAFCPFPFPPFSMLSPR